MLFLNVNEWMNTTKMTYIYICTSKTKSFFYDYEYNDFYWIIRRIENEQNHKASWKY